MAIPWFDRQAMTFQATNPTNYVNSKAQLTKGYAVDDSIASGYAPRQAGILSLLGKSLTGIAAPFVGDTQWLQNETAQQLRQQQADQEFQALLMKNAMEKQAALRKTQSVLTPEQQVETFVKTRGLAKDQGLDPDKLSLSVAANGVPSLSMRAAGGLGGAAAGNAMNKRTEQVYNTIYDNYNTNDNISRALDSVGKLESGLKGKVTYNVIKNLDANNPLLGDWQNLKMALTDAQLAASGPLKGAISDAENKWLAAAAGNDDLISVPRAKSVLDKLSRASKIKEESVVSSYKKMYKDDPYQWDGIKELKSSKGNTDPRYDAAIKAGYKPEEIDAYLGKRK